MITVRKPHCQDSLAFSLLFSLPFSKLQCHLMKDQGGFKLSGFSTLVIMRFYFTASHQPHAAKILGIDENVKYANSTDPKHWFLEVPGRHISRFDMSFLY